MTEKLTRRGLHIHTDYEPDVLHRVAVRETMSRDVPTIASTMTVNEFARRIAQHDPVLTRHQGLPIVNDHGHLVGLITRGDLLRALEGDPEGNQTVLEAGSQNPIVAFANESLYDAATRMLQRNIGRLPVVERVEPTRLVGYLGRSGILSARIRVLEEEHIREQGWWPSKSGDRVIG